MLGAEVAGTKPENKPVQMRCILGETGIARIPRYTNCAALVLVCSLIVHALQVSLHQERAIVGASHWQFWSLAGGI